MIHSAICDPRKSFQADLRQPISRVLCHPRVGVEAVPPSEAGSRGGLPVQRFVRGALEEQGAGGSAGLHRPFAGSRRYDELVNIN